MRVREEKRPRLAGGWRQQWREGHGEESSPDKWRKGKASGR
jgi:hypothetical protein